VAQSYSITATVTAIGVATFKVVGM